MPPVVSLPMYVQAAEAIQAFWSGLRRHLAEAGLPGLPEDLFWPDDFRAHWLSPATLLSQACGYPLVTLLAGRVQLVGTFRYAAPGCEGSDYASLVVVREDDPARTVADLAGRRAAFNSRDSQSGYNSLRALVAPHVRDGRFFGAVIESGGHASSMRLVREGGADVAAIDCVTHALAARADPQAVAGLRTLCLSERAPGLPLITAQATSEQDLARLRSAIAAACADPALAEQRAAFLLEGFDVRPLADYDRCLEMQERAKALGYPELA